jgi:TldD protein
MYLFPKGLYVDVRIEDIFETNIAITNENIDQFKEKSYKAAFIRVFDGKKWYYSAVSSAEKIQEEINSLAAMATPDENILENPIVKKYEIHKDKKLKFTEESVRDIAKEEKLALLKKYYPIINKKEYVKVWQANYVDFNVIKTICSSLGTDLTFDYQRLGFRLGFQLSDGKNTFEERADKGSNYFKDIENCENLIEERYREATDYLLNAEDVEPGVYTVILSPESAGVFAHESFGHKSEADFMIGDEQMKAEWALGKKIGSDILSIVDTGKLLGAGNVEYDDEGTKAKENYLIKNGVLSGRLHSVLTATSLEENPTGNARAVNFEYEPIVRMTTTYIKEGSETKEELFSKVKNGFYIKTIKHGSGMSTFTIAPSLAYKIKDGKIEKPAKISVITGNVFKTLGDIDGLSNECEFLTFTLGGCGKMEQFPLPVGFGGPLVRVNNINVQ